MTNSFPYPQALIFDWDNTLVDSWPAITDALNKARSAYGLETWSVEEARVKSTRAMRVSFPEWFGDEWENAGKIFYGHYEATHAQLVKPLDGAESLLALGQELGLPMMVVSNKRNDLLRQEIDAFGWGHHFLSVKGVGDTPHDKPHPEPVEVALKEAEVSLSNGPVWFIGDSSADVDCAERSGTIPVLVYDLRLAQERGVSLAFSDCHKLRDALYNQSRLAN